MRSELTDNSLKLNNNDIILTASSGVLSVTFNVANYSTSGTYTIGDYCYYSSSVYVCKKDTPSPAGAFDESCWKER